MPSIIDDIAEIATLMRKVTKHYIRSNEGMEQTMGGFCIPASLALRNTLEESGYDDSRVVRGRFQNKGHAWVETQGKIIDIILDQFGGFPSICISDVGDMRYSAVTDDDELKNMGLARIGKTKVFLQRATGSVLPWAARCVTQGAGCGYRRNVSDFGYGV